MKKDLIAALREYRKEYRNDLLENIVDAGCAVVKVAAMAAVVYIAASMASHVIDPKQSGYVEPSKQAELAPQYKDNNAVKDKITESK